MKKNLAYILVIAIAAIAILSISLWDVKTDRDRCRANQTALMSDVLYYKTENGKNAASVQKLELTVDEFKANYDSVCQVAKDLGIKVKRIQSAAITATETKVEVITKVRDSIVYVESKAVPMRLFDWSDPWVDVSGRIAGDSVGLRVASRDTITQIVHRVPHRFWFIKWGCKAIRQEVVSSNPHTKIVYSEYIELKK